jgi:hypothetical protein
MRLKVRSQTARPSTLLTRGGVVSAARKTAADTVADSHALVSRVSLKCALHSFSTKNTALMRWRMVERVSE